ncbi:nuclear transport factor 2 family protein [Thalassospira xiamenensis]|uniref:nuclear transport factor 2 family protein n=1 Tax=Thalassospira xiamenensis TaxID=220697 RepID=UPI001FFFD198|nr:nuclear transport factor 2 family protein [Thalassospira xiamenensis]MCK2167111.1 nuclear transport factor 2 family protein [Thalassospira xiamenensis]
MDDVHSAKLETLKAYGDYFANLGPETVENLHHHVTPDYSFTDPFNTINGPDRVCAYLDKMFRDTENPQFIVTHNAVDNDLGFLRWRFTASISVLGNWDVTGMSAVTFSDDGTRISSHVDHWDSGMAFYARIPVLGWFIRRLAARMAVS